MVTCSHSFSTRNRGWTTRRWHAPSHSPSETRSCPPSSGASRLELPGQLRQLVAGRPEGVADGHVDVLVAAVEAGIAAGHDVSAGNQELDADVEVTALALVAVRRLDRDLAAADAGVEALEALGLLVDDGAGGG